MLLLGTLLLSACATPGERPAALFQRTASDAALTPTQPGTASAADLDLWRQESWWQAYGDPQLNRLVEQLLTQRHSQPALQLAAARLRRAEAAAGLAEAARLPQATAGAESSRQRYTENGMVPPPWAGNFASNNRIAIDASYELDLWGKQREQWTAALSQAQAAQADAAQAELLLTAALVQTYLRLDRTWTLADIAEAAHALRQRQEALTAKRVSAGVDARDALLNATAATASAAQELAAQREQLSLLRHQLAALLGLEPGELPALTMPQLQTPNRALPTVLPLDLLGRRPDLVASRWRVEAARGEEKAAQTLFYPNLNLTAFLGWSAIGSKHLLDGSSGVVGLTPAIRLPLFDGGKLRANLGQREAERDQAIAQYNQTLLDAVREVADQLASRQATARQQAEAEAALTASASSRDLSRQRAAAGVASELTTLTADAVWLDRRRQAAEARLRLFDADLGLIRALGGSYREPARNETNNSTHNTNNNSTSRSPA